MSGSIKKLNDILTRREKIQLAILFVATIFMAFTQVVGVASVLPFISLVMDPSMVFENRWLLWIYELFNFTSLNRFVAFVGIAMFTIIVLSNAVSALATWMKLRFAWMNNHRLSRRLMEKYLAMPYAFFLNQNSAYLSKNVLNEVNNLTGSYILPIMTIITRGLVALFILAMLFWIDAIVSVVAIFLLGGSYLLLFWGINKKLEQRGELRMQSNKARFKIVSEAFGGIKEIKVMNLEPYYIDRYSGVSFEHARLLSWNAVIGQIPRYALEAIAFGGIILFVLFMLLTSDDVRQVIPLATLFAFAGYRLMPALQEIFTSFTQLQFHKAVLENIHADYTTVPDNLHEQTLNINKLPEALPFEREIRLDKVSYNYPGSIESVIKEVSLEIKQNTAVAFVGPTGAGKTTLVDIILGLLRPREGYVLVDDFVIKDDVLPYWQRNIGYVPQHIYLADDTVAHNIAFGLPDDKIEISKLEQAARVANIHDFIINELPAGYDTLVGERGIRLSGGQRQRIGIARALYHDPALLVFDEATSALDGITEKTVLDAMENASRLKTLVIIAHRMTTVEHCDRIYMMEYGEIVDSGTYGQLLKNNEHFKNMAKARS